MSRFVFVLALVLGHPALARGHDLKDGEIERDVQVSVKSDSVLVEYSVAMNKVTLAQELRTHGQKPAKTLSAMWKQYQEVILPVLNKHLELTVAGEKSPFEPIRAEFSGWSHLHLTCLFKAEISLTQQPRTIVFTDGNFHKALGKYRIAMKGRSGAKMAKSTVPPLVSRAKPVVLAKLTPEQNQAATRAEGEFALDIGR
ncbi:MAG: hypothetical protein MPJ50_13150 [Pirellulales bacterium]|nr:hypothetical protein [Pirellulales bacterium]